MKKKIFAFVFVVLAISIFTLNSFALAPPQITSVLATDYTGAVTADEADKLFMLVNYQYLSGSFNGLDPLLLRISSSGAVQLYLVDGHYDVYYTQSGTTVTVTGGSSQVVKAVLTSEGFSIQSNFTGSPANYEASSVIGFASGLNKLWTRCELYTTGTAQGRANAPYQLWSTYYFNIVQYEYNVEHAEQVGYQNGYNTGHTVGVSEGYQLGEEYGRTMGYNSGYNDGVQAGYEDGYVDGYSEGIQEGGGGSELIPVTFRFFNGDHFYEGDPLVKAILISNGTDFLFWPWKDVYPPFSELPDGWFVYSLDMEILLDQYNDPSSIRFHVPDDIHQAFPNFNWAVVASSGTIYQLDVFLFDDSFEAGYQSGLQDGDLILNGIADIATAPVAGLKSALDFEIFGVNVGAVAIGCVAVALLLIAWRFIRKLLPI